MTATLDPPITASADVPQPTRRRSALRRFMRNRLAVAGAVVLVLLVVVAVFAPVLAPYDPNDQDLLGRFQRPGGDHFLGTDDFGRDALSRLIFGTRVSVLFSLTAMVTSLVFGMPQGLIAGFVGGRTDSALSRFNELLMSVPGLLLVITVVGVLGPGLVTSAVTIGAISSPRFFRVVRGVTQDVRGETYIEASRALGCTTRRTLIHQVLPNVLGPLIVQIAIGLGTFVTAEASLSFIGLGVRPPTASWGGMLQTASANMISAPFLVYAPGLVIGLTVLAYMLVGDGLRSAVGTTRSAVSEG